MATFRKRPVEVQAVQWDGTDEMFDHLLEWASSDESLSMSRGYLYVHTLEGEMCANRGDWIIRGVKGELYPCKADIFAETYDPT